MSILAQLFHRYVTIAVRMVPDDNIPASRHRLRGIVTYEVNADDFERIETEASTVGTDIQFATVLISTAISFSVTLLTVSIPNQHLHDLFSLITVVGFALGGFFAVRGWRERGHLKRLLSRIRASQVGPVGEQGKEMRPTELDLLPLEASPQPTEAPTEISAAAEEQFRLALELLEAKIAQMKSEKK